ncbi:hypothetical protein AMECASPLE_002355 [Ameca splendens]|uniref:Uncharacterized protein n=1 Tax=Ameca splendens TaxID=208324 RepID=A0ABV0ZKL8_9TELE
MVLDGVIHTSTSQSAPKKKKKQGREAEMPKMLVRRPWSEAEKNAVNKHLAKFMAERRVPGKEHCMQCKEKERALDDRSWKDVKNFVYNTIVTLSRRSASKKLKF